jgi:hypothetical protein
MVPIFIGRGAQKLQQSLVSVCGFKRILAATRTLWLPTKNIENNPMQSAGGRR